MRVAIVDLGTNTFNLLIADVSGKDFTVVYAGREVVKLGEKSINENQISEAAYQRGLRAIENHARVMKEKKTEMVRAFATSAIREAQNGKRFIDEVKRNTGIDVNVIDGEREAELIYLGNRLAVDLDGEKHLIMDIGGGSNEFIIADKNTIYWKHSFKLGVARLLERFQPGNPITDETVKAVHDYLEKEMSALSAALREHKVKCLVGSSGGFESVVDMIAEAFNREGVTPQKHAYLVDLDDYRKISQRTVHSTFAERETMKGLIPMRRDMIVLTYLLIDKVIQLSGVQQLKVSAYSLKEGALSELIVNNC